MSPKSHKFHFYCDENFPVKAGEFLKSKGHSVVFAFERNNLGLQDLSQLLYANKHNWTFLTQDLDFLKPTFSTKRIAESQGVVIMQTDLPNAIQYKRILTKFLSEITPRQIEGRICVASIDSVKIKNPE